MTSKTMAARFNILMAMAMVCCVAGAVPTPAPVSPCGTVAPVVTTVTTTPASPCGTVAPVVTTVTTTLASPCGTVAPVVSTVTTTPASPCGTVSPVVYTTVTTTPAPLAPTPAPVVYTTVTTTPAPPAPVGTYTTTPGATGTTTPGATYTTTPAGTYTTTPGATYTTTPAVAPAAKFAAEKVSDAEKKGSSLIQGSPIIIGLFSLLLASAAVGMIVRVTRSYRRTTRVTFNGRQVSHQDDACNDVLESDLEYSREPLIE